jgi:hypothetical protein
MEMVRTAVDHGAAPSLNAFMEHAAESYLRELRREAVFESYAEAAQDSVFRKHIQEVGRDFDTTTPDGMER